MCFIFADPIEDAKAAASAISALEGVVDHGAESLKLCVDGDCMPCTGHRNIIAANHAQHISAVCASGLFLNMVDVCVIAASRGVEVREK